MSTEFLTARNGDETCKYQGVLLHSMYNPSGEAERFVQSLTSPFIPKTVFIFEPALSNQIEFLREKFKGSTLCAIRILKDFSSKDHLWDKVYYYNDDLENNLFNDFGEINLSFSLFTAWPVSSKTFQDQYVKTVSIFKSLISKSHSILKTRSFFESRWIMNSINMALFTKNTLYPVKKSIKPVLVVCSGPSLIPILENKDFNFSKYYLIAVSSAVLPLIERNIIPDLVISTDGGFWAKKHIEILKNHTEIPLALATEGNVPLEILQKSPVFPLGYNDGLETKIVETSGIRTTLINRNGTVSGTALETALSLSDNDVYFAGLDLALQTGYQHTQNNALESMNSQKDKKNRSKESRMTAQEFSNQKMSLEIYANWFSNVNFGNRKVYRIIDAPKNTLGKIKDISSKNFFELSQNYNTSQKELIFENKKFTRNISNIKKLIEDTFKNVDNLQNIFPLEYFQWKQSINSETLKSSEEKLLELSRNLEEKLKRRLSCIKV